MNIVYKQVKKCNLQLDIACLINFKIFLELYSFQRLGLSSPAFAKTSFFRNSCGTS